MSRWPMAAAAAPGVVVVAAALAGWVPHARDLPAYFLPLRAHTAQVLRGQASPFWLEQVGCGEPFFANPQSALLYPPSWGALLLPAATAVGVEVGLHLALLGVGTVLLARRLGCSGGWAAAAGLGAVAAGPVVESAGVLNNLAALAWLPWGWEGALAGALGRCAAFTALAFLAGEPQLAVVGGAVSLLLAPSRRTLGALVLAAGAVAVQGLPFAFWVAGGDRGPGMEAGEAARGALPWALLPAVAFPGLGRGEDAFLFVTHPGLSLWVLVGVGVALARSGPPRRLALAALGCLAVAVAASTELGGKVWAWGTWGLLRYPARLLLPAAVAAAAAAAAAWSRAAWPRGAGAALALGLGAVGVGAGASVLPTAAQALAVGLAPLPPWGGAAAAAGSLATMALHGPALSLGRAAHWVLPCGEEQRRAARLFLVEPSRAMLAWVAQDPLPRAAALGLGYHPLQDGRSAARTFAPLASAALAAHLREADRGPAGRWWLDSLGADVLLSLHPIPGFPLRCAEGGLVVHDNPYAWPRTAVLAALPAPEEGLMRAGEVVRQEGGGGYHRWEVRAEGEGAVLLWLATPDPGWRYRVNGEPVKALSGVGIVQGIPVPGGTHTVTARYRPPGLGWGAVITLASLGAMVRWWRKRREEAGR